MRKVILLFIIATIVACQGTREEYQLTISNITIIDPVNKSSTSGQSIHISGDTISLIEPTSRSTEIHSQQHIDGTGKFAIAGYWNMHTHLCWMDGLDTDLFPILLSYGIVGVRDMGGDLNILNTFKNRLSTNPSSGPHLIGPGPLIDGKDPIHPDFSVVLTEENHQKVLDSLYRNHVDFLKVYSLLPKNLVEKVAAFADAHDLPFVGHISEYITPLEAVNLGQKSIEHLNRVEELRHDTAALDTLILGMHKQKSWLCPTLVIYQRKLDLALGRKISHPLDSIIPPILQSEWSLARSHHPHHSDSIGIDAQNLFNERMALVKTMYDGEIQFLIGSDFAGMPFIYPGLGFHQEMELMQDLGFDPYDILKMATYNPALFLNITKKHGSLEAGKLADMVVLNTNPVEDIRNTLDIHTVIKSGQVVIHNP